MKNALNHERIDWKVLARVKEMSLHVQPSGILCDLLHRLGDAIAEQVDFRPKADVGIHTRAITLPGKTELAAQIGLVGRGLTAQRGRAIRKLGLKGFLA